VKEGKFSFVFPTASFAGLLFVLAAMWYAASSQNSPAVYLLLFALMAVFLVSIPHTTINLSDVTIAVESPRPVFAGEEVALPIEIVNGSRATRHGINLALPGFGREGQRIDHIPAGKAARMTLRFLTQKRGEYKIGTLCLTSAYPLGFIRIFKKFASSRTYLVYPKPVGEPRLPSSLARSPRSQPQTDFGEGDDFAGVRAYIPGESQRHIDWKAVARGQPLMTKQFAAEAAGAVCLDFSALRFADVEARLSQLALWVIEAERARLPYGLYLPGVKMPPAVGQSHFHQCLRALSLFQLETPGCLEGFRDRRSAPTSTIHG
jgi:uncharacterized protein (DUF58 family)